MLSALLSSDTDTTNGGVDWITWVILAVFIVIIVVFFVFTSRRNKKKQEEAQQLMDAVKPGNKVKTIGGVCGIVVEVDSEENTFVLETGSETTGKCYMKFDKQAIYQTDAVVDKKEEEKGDKSDKKDETPSAEEPFEENAPAAKPENAEEPEKDDKTEKSDKK